MAIRPILSSLFRHKIVAALIVLEVAFTCAIFCNAVYLIAARIQRIDRPSGIVESEVLRIRLSAAKRGEEDALAQTRTDLAALRSVHGVLSVVVTNQIAYGDSSTNSGVKTRAEQENPTLDASIYMSGAGLIDTLGVKLVSGRDFREDEFIDWKPGDAPGDISIPTAILTRDTAERLYPGQNAVGQSFYSWGGTPTRIVGVIERLIRPSDTDDASAINYSMIFPVNLPYTGGASFLLRTVPGQQERVLADATKVLARSGPRRTFEIDNGTLESMRDRYYRTDRAMAWLLALVCAALLVITTLGIVGLASFWVQQRVQSIGVRRALGASRKQILMHFQIENLVLTGVGTMLGMLLAFALNTWLMRHYELSRLPIEYLPVGALCLLVLGQIAVLYPALQAAAIPPAIATRNA